MSLRHWVNDGLMALFFFILGLEIKRELLVGELREPARALPVIAAAAGGMFVPALLYYDLNHGGDTIQGWAIPMATDTAFAIGILVPLGTRVPVGLTTFLLAVAIIDDMDAVLVIALFYSDTISVAHLGTALALLDEFEDIDTGNGVVSPILAEPEQHSVVEQLQETAAEATIPLQLWERALEHPIALFALPLFALVNAGIAGASGYLWLRFACKLTINR
jgi:Na+/H+ antiporter NhaA